MSLAQNPRFIALIEESRRFYQEQGGVPLNDVRKALGLTPKGRKATPRKKPERAKK